MNRIRLERLVAILSAVDERTFNLSSWYDTRCHPWQLPGTQPDESPCGFTACAVGWACKDPIFNAQGLKLRDREPRYGKHEGWEAVRQFFDLGHHDASHLFSDSHYSTGASTTAAQVAERINEFLSE